MNRAPSPESAWIRQRSRGLGRFHAAAIVAGTLQIAAVLVQAWLLAGLVHGLVIDGAVPATWAPALAGIGAAALVRALLAFLREEAGNAASRRFRFRLRNELFAALHRRGPAWVSGQEAGDLSSKIADQVDAFDEYFAKYLPQRVLAGIGPVLTAAVVFPLNWACGVLLLGTAPLIPFFMALVGWGTRAEQEKQLDALSKMSGRFLGLLRGLPSLRALMAHERQEEVVAATGAEFRERTMRVLRLAFLSSAVLEFFTMLSIALVAIYLGFSFLGIFDFGTWGGTLVLAHAVFILLAAPEFFQPLRDLGTHYHARSDAMAAASRLSEITLEKPGAPVTMAAPLRSVSAPPAIECRGLHFSYGPDATVFGDFSLAVAAGEAVVLTGPSGCGKTTLLQILLGHSAPDSGRVLVDGEPISGGADWQSWRESVGWMGQHPALIAGSLRDNLLLARRSAEDSELERAIAEAGLDPWYRSLPDGLDTALGDGARRVSGGQARRLALARLVLRPARVLLLDEPTASLDAENAELVTQRIRRLREGRTLIAFSHRSELFAVADRVLDFSDLMAAREGSGRR